MSLVCALSVASLLLGCDGHRSIVGEYIFVYASPPGFPLTSPKVSLSIGDDNKYTLCFANTNCERGNYHLESMKGDYYDQLYFHGPRMIAFLGGSNVGSVYYLGFFCPCIFSGDPDTGDRFQKSSIF